MMMMTVTTKASEADNPSQSIANDEGDDYDIRKEAFV